MNIVFRVDSSVQMGSGHVMRCLTLAEEVRQHGMEPVFISRDLPGNMCTVIENRGFEVYRLPLNPSGAKPITEGPLHAHWLEESWDMDAEQTIQILKHKQRIDWVVVDHYALDEQWEKRIRPYTEQIMVIDDLADRSHDCDVLLDQNLNENMETRYDTILPNHCVKLLGPLYALLRGEFREARERNCKRDGTVRRIFVFFGGSDPTNETSKAIQALFKIDKPEIMVDVVVGKANPHKEHIRHLCSLRPKTNYHCQVNNIANLMAEADLAIGAAGTTTWERCAVGLPALMISVASNQEKIAEQAHKHQIGYYLGKSEQITSADIHSHLQYVLKRPELLKQMSQSAFQTVDGQGAWRVTNTMMKMGV
jgi:UDP-2,4-diacetamido-2,4,6-trideoxy-beta-L-altropyranose hydrolase